MSTVIGDSNVYGYGGVTPWPDLLGYDNYGQSASRLGDWIRHEEWFPEVVDGELYIQLGSNDVGLPISVNYSAWLSTLAQRSLNAGADSVILLYPPPRLMNSVDAQTAVDARLLEIQYAMNAACDRAPAVVHCEPVLSELSTDMLISDGLHFTQAAHDHIADVIAVPEPPGALLIGMALLCVIALWWFTGR